MFLTDIRDERRLMFVKDLYDNFSKIKTIKCIYSLQVTWGQTRHIKKGANSLKILQVSVVNPSGIQSSDLGYKFTQRKYCKYLPRRYKYLWAFSPLSLFKCSNSFKFKIRDFFFLKNEIFSHFTEHNKLLWKDIHVKVW